MQGLEPLSGISASAASRSRTVAGAFRKTAVIAVLGALTCAAGCGPKRPVEAGRVEPARPAHSDQLAREFVGITVYNQNFGVVRERRRIGLGTGRVELSYADVASGLEPQTVHIRAVEEPRALSVLEQNYRYDLLSPETLLKKFQGKTIKVYRYNEKLGTEEEKSAEVLAAEPRPVLRIDGQVTYDFPGRFAFPNVPENLLAKPTLVWLLTSEKPEQRVEVTYLTSGLNFSADYVLVLSADDTKGDLTGWVTLTNESGASFENAELKLVAGDVQRVQPAPPQVMTKQTVVAAMARAAPQFREEGLFEYHLYTLERPTSLRDKEQKQISLLEAHDLQLQKKLILRSAPELFRPVTRQPTENQKVSVFVEFVNAEKNGLGKPLPKGVIRVYKADQGGSKQFVGEDSIDHTAVDEKLEIKLGESFDVVADRRQMQVTQLSPCSTESQWEITVRNHKRTAERVEVNEPTGGDWEVVKSSHPARREDAKSFAFDLSVPALGEVKLTYTVRVRWC